MSGGSLAEPRGRRGGCHVETKLKIRIFFARRHCGHGEKKWRENDRILYKWPADLAESNRIVLAEAACTMVVFEFGVRASASSVTWCDTKSRPAAWATALRNDRPDSGHCVTRQVGGQERPDWRGVIKQVGTGATGDGGDRDQGSRILESQARMIG